MIIEWGVMSDLVALDSSRDSNINAMSADGDVIVFYSYDESNTNHVVKFLGSDSEGNILTPEKLGDLGGNYSYISAVSEDGTVIVGVSRDEYNNYYAVKFLGSDSNGNTQTPVELGTLDGPSEVTAMSSDGKVIIGKNRDGSNDNYSVFRRKLGLRRSLNVYYDFKNGYDYTSHGASLRYKIMF